MTFRAHLNDHELKKDRLFIEGRSFFDVPYGIAQICL